MERWSIAWLHVKFRHRFLHTHQTIRWDFLLQGSEGSDQCWLSGALSYWELLWNYSGYLVDYHWQNWRKPGDWRDLDTASGSRAIHFWSGEWYRVLWFSYWKESKAEEPYLPRCRAILTLLTHLERGAEAREARKELLEKFPKKNHKDLFERLDSLQNV